MATQTSATNRAALIIGIGAGATIFYLLWNRWKDSEIANVVDENEESQLGLEFDLPPFKWNLSVEDIQNSTEAVLLAAENNLNQVANSEASFQNTIRPLRLAPNYKTNHLVCQSKFLQHASPDANIRAVAEEAGQKFAKFKTCARMRLDVYEKVLEFSKNNAQEDQKNDKLSIYDQHFVDSLLCDFQKGGLALNEKKRNELQQLLAEDTACCSNYKTNLGEDSTTLVFKRDELRGLSESFMNARADPDDSNSIILYLKYPDILPVLTDCEVAATREKMNQAREAEAYGNNLKLVAQGAQIRYHIAQLLNKKSWAHVAIGYRMAQTPEKVIEFLQRIRELSQSGLEKDLSSLRECKRKHLLKLSQEFPKEYEKIAGKSGFGPEMYEEVKAWDVAFYHSQILKESFGVDGELIREYFPIDHVVNTTMEIYQSLLALTFTEIPKHAFESWHHEVRLFVVHDAQTGKRQGHFYLDLHPREGKYGHAAIFHLLKRNGSQTPVDCMLCNLPAASSEGPALLRHGNVVTFFHEFGHIMHGLCTEGEGNATSLAKVPRDFVEAPSQMLENWCWDPEMLRKLSKHHVTQEPLPMILIESMLRARSVHASLFTSRQVYLSLLDMSIHGESPPKNEEDLQKLVDFLRSEVSGITNPPNCNMLRNFGHLMNQYSAGYYGYLWAEVISADMFSTCFAHDIESIESGKRYRELILAPGGTGKILDHVCKFLGRAPDEKPFLQARNII